MAKKSRSFSLVELLLAATIFSIIVVAMYSGFRNGVSAWRRLSAVTQVHQKARSALEIIFTDLNNYVPSRHIETEGSSDSLSFFAACPGKHLNRISYYVESGTLIRKMEGLREVFAGDTEGPEGRPAMQHIAASVEAIEFSYYCRTEKEEPEWFGSLDSQENTELLGIEAKITLKDDVEFSRKILLYAKGIDEPEAAEEPEA